MKKQLLFNIFTITLNIFLASCSYSLVKPQDIKNQRKITSLNQEDKNNFKTLSNNFNEEAYKLAYPDVALAIKQGTLRTASDHYYCCGYRIDSLQYIQAKKDVEEGYNEEKYLNSFTDVKKAVESGVLPNGYTHFINSGRNEGRLQDMIDGYDENTYLLAFPNVRDAISKGIVSSGYWHYNPFGKNSNYLKRNEYLQAINKIKLNKGKIIKKVMVLGNSLTLHGPYEPIGWFLFAGMAASSAEKDYAHVLTSYISQYQGNTNPELLVDNISDFERDFYYSSLDRYKTHIDFNADIIVIQLGNNTNETITIQQDFTRHYEKLISAFQNNNPSIFCLGSWYPKPIVDNMMKEACENKGGTYISLNEIYSDNSNFAFSERNFIYQGVATHPGDKGMKEIASLIFNIINLIY
ncbi:MAG: SGNH/GDSL hydrolase family protein [Candidatus Sericytochromatia bacterium]